MRTPNLHLHQVMPRIITKLQRSCPRTPRDREPDSSVVVHQGVMFQRQPREREFWTLATQ